MALRVTNSTGSPPLAAHAAAGMANSARSPEATTTASAGLPATRAANRSTDAATANGFDPGTRAARSPPGAGTEPTRITWAPPSWRAPVGSRAPSAFLVASGSEPDPVSSVGARSGRDISTDAATPDCQSPESTSATARGRALDSSGVNTAWATAAASAVGSAPPTRVVFLVANCGKPSCWAALDSSPLRPMAGDCPRLPWPWPQAERASEPTMTEHAATGRRSTGRSVAGRLALPRCFLTTENWELGTDPLVSYAATIRVG